MKGTQTEKNCIFCGNSYEERDNEHVFPDGLGGQKVFMDCVCQKCNNRFSGLEIELYQKLLGFIRSMEGVPISGTLSRYPTFKAPLLLTFDVVNKVVYEVGQTYPQQIFLRPQILKIGTDYFVEGSVELRIHRLREKFLKWRKDDLNITFKVDNRLVKKQFSIQSREFILASGDFDSKTQVNFYELPSSHELYSFLTPRLFLDDDDKLFLRARTIDEALNFLKDLIAATSSPLLLNSNPNKDLAGTVVYVGFSFDMKKSERALVKIGLNCLIHYFPSVKYRTEIRDGLSFVKAGTPTIMGKVTERSDIIDNTSTTHNVFFYQLADSLEVRVGLFNGAFVFNFGIPNLTLFKVNEYKRLVINYKKRSANLESSTEFFDSFKSE